MRAGALHYIVLAIPFFFSPLVFSKYGAEGFGFFSLLLSWSVLGSCFYTVRTEVLLNEAGPKKSREHTINRVLGVFTYFGVPFFCVFLCGSILVESMFALYVVLVSFIVSLFNIVNTLAVIRGGLWFSMLHLSRVSILYVLLFSLPTDNVSIVISIALSFLFPVIVFFIKLGIPVKVKRFPSYKLSYINARNGVMFLGAFVVGNAREALLASFILYNFGEHEVGVYYLVSLYMVKSGVAYSTLQGNKIKYVVSNEIGVDFVGEVLKLGFIVLVGFVVGIFLYWFVGVEIGFDASQAISLFPLTLSYLFFFPFVVLYECYGLGKVSLYYNSVSVGILIVSCMICYILSIKLFSFLLLYSSMFFILMCIQSYRVLLFHKGRC